VSHSYEEIRSVVLDLLAGRESTPHGLQQFQQLMGSTAAVFATREDRLDRVSHMASKYVLVPADRDTLLEVFWDLFREGVITLGINHQNSEFPFFRLTRFGKRIAEDASVYFFHDVSSYETAVRRDIPDVHEVTLLYLKEAMQAFRAGCMLSATVMLGVAAEHDFGLLLETLKTNPAHEKTFGKAISERTLLGRFNAFTRVVTPMRKSLPAEIAENMETHLGGILSVIRTSRNDSGHPTGKIIEREQVYVLLHLFISYCKKLHQLRSYFQLQADHPAIG